MSNCRFSKEILYAWLDGEAGDATDSVVVHLTECPGCAQEVERVRASGKVLRTLVDEAVGEVEPLVALQKIRQRIDEQERRAQGFSLQRGWDSLWENHRVALAGAAFAFALGALVAPAVLYFAGSSGGEAAQGIHPVRTASVTVESVEIEGGAKTVVLQPEGSSTAVIWIDSGDTSDDGSTR